jgi:hypothetical protein
LLVLKTEDRGLRDVLHGLSDGVAIGATAAEGGDRDDEHAVFILLDQDRQMSACDFETFSAFYVGHGGPTLLLRRTANGA